MLLSTWLMLLTRRDLRSQRRSSMLFSLTSHWQLSRFLSWETRLTYLMLPQRMSCAIIWDWLTSRQVRGRLIWRIPMSAHWRCSCAALSEKWGMAKDSSGFLNTSSRQMNRQASVLQAIEMVVFLPLIHFSMFWQFLSIRACVKWIGCLNAALCSSFLVSKPSVPFTF